jgi:hypothetical protein
VPKKKKKKVSAKIDLGSPQLEAATGRESYAKSEYKQKRIVDLLERNGPMSVPDLAAELGCSAGSAYYQLKKLAVSKRARLRFVSWRGQQQSWALLPGQKIDDDAVREREARAVARIHEAVEAKKAENPYDRRGGRKPKARPAEEDEDLGEPIKRAVRAPAGARGTLRQIEVQIELLQQSLAKLRDQLGE